MEEKAILLALRGISCPSSATSAHLSNLLVGISQVDQNAQIAAWRECMGRVQKFVSFFANHDIADVNIHLGCIYGATIPLSLTFIKQPRVTKLLALYAVKYGLGRLSELGIKIPIDDVQEGIIQKCLTTPCDVRGGPGTGKSTTLHELASRMFVQKRLVLIVSRSIHAVRETYFRLIRAGIPCSKLGERKPDSPIWIATVGDLASQVIVTKYNELSFMARHNISSEQILGAITALKSGKRNAFPRVTYAYTDILVDDPDPSGLELIRLISKTLGARLFLFGATVNPTEHCILTRAYRFKNTDLVGLVGEDVAIHPCDAPELPRVLVIAPNDGGFHELEGRIRASDLYRSAAILCEKYDKTFVDMHSYLLNKGHRCYSSGSGDKGKFQATGLFMGTIDDALGREFDLVITFNIHLASKESVVGAVSRARKQVWHVLLSESSHATIPPNVRIGRVGPPGATVSEHATNTPVPGPTRYRLCDMAVDPNFQQFLAINGQTIRYRLCQVDELDEKIRLIIGSPRDQWVAPVEFEESISEGLHVCGTYEHVRFIDAPEHRLLAALSRTKYIVNVANRQIEEIHPIDPYYIQAFCQIKYHVEFVQKQAQARAISAPIIKPSVYICDTEFVSEAVIKYYEVACLNVANPFLSIVSPIKCDHINARTNLNCAQEYLNTCPTMEQFVARFKEQIKESYLLYYCATADVEPFAGLSMDVSGACGFLALQRGFFYTGRSGYTPKLGEIYNALCVSIESQPHLKQHRALSDTLLIYDLIVLGYIRCG